ncbi:MAG: histidine phosphotransferase family protein [Paracoccaceae bacterium]|nr:histidine phosphotransferase family protein [Paracoccaceae bacterium]MDP5344822.1 histidine phosphotransferase family protein [Paracoccaceae bacterium]
MTKTTDISHILAARICHDIVSPLGAIGNGVELLEMTEMRASPEIALLSDSVESLVARLRFFRVAFGTAALDQRMGRPEVISTAELPLKEARLRLDWTVPSDLPRNEVRLAYLLLLCLGSALPLGGVISLERGEKQWLITATGGRIKPEPDLWDMLVGGGGGPDIGPNQIQFPLARNVMTQMRRKLSAQWGENSISLQY